MQMTYVGLNGILAVMDVLEEQAEQRYSPVNHALVVVKMAPGYFNPEWHEEYGALYGVTLRSKMLREIEAKRADREEIKKLALYSQVKGKEKIAEIDEKLLEYWK